jgi:beta-lactamase class A
MHRALVTFAVVCLAAGQDLQKDLERIAAHTGGRVGVSAVLIESGEHIALHGDQPFFMASVVKFPVALRVLDLVDDDKLRLDQRISVNPSDRAPGVSTLDGRFKPGALFTVRELLEFMILNSDNTACDVLLRMCGGPPAVQSRLEAMGIHGIRVDRTEKEMAAVYSESRVQFLKDLRDDTRCHGGTAGEVRTWRGIEARDNSIPPRPDGTGHHSSEPSEGPVAARDCGRAQDRNLARSGH